MSSTSKNADASDKFHVGLLRDLAESAFERARGMSYALARLESKLFEEELAQVLLTAPIYVSGLARAGTTLMLEVLAAHSQTVPHHYRDYPGLRCPIFWKRFVDMASQRQIRPVERAHQDGIMVTPDSPEAFEEILWMDFFDRLHDPSCSNVLGCDTSNPAFEDAYRDHIRKLLFAYGGSRYLAKGNYNVARLEYILSLFPDARFVIVVRDPVGHVGSLMRQHASFAEAQRRHPRSRAHLRRIGHFEFGLDRQPINFGQEGLTASILDLWATGREVAGWARYWSATYRHVFERLAANAALREATYVVSFERLCDAPAEVIHGMIAHAGLSDEDAIAARVAAVRAPKYYDPGFTQDELRAIEAETAATVARVAEYLDRSVMVPA